jgi:hypothetical protein
MMQGCSHQNQQTKGGYHMSGVFFFIICVCALSLYSINHKMSTGMHATLLALAFIVSLSVGASAG